MLPEQFQIGVVLHDLQGIGVKDIPETLGQPIGTVKSNEFGGVCKYFVKSLGN